MEQSHAATREGTGSGSLQPILAGVTTALVGFTSSSAIVIAGLRAVGADLDQATSGLVALCLVQGLGIIWLALRHRSPITLAWSTPGAALLAGAAGSSLTGASPSADPAAWSAAVGAFLVVAVLILLTGLWRGLSDLIARIPAALAQAMLAGVLLPLCLAPVHALTVSPLAVAPVIVVWLVLLRLAPKWAVPTAFALALAIAVAFAMGVGRSVDASVAPAFALASMLPSVSLTMPSFTLGAVLGIAAPLYLVTMVSQNVPGVAVMRANGFDVPWRESMLVTGVATAVAAPAGGHAVNLAAISAALAAGPDAHPLRSRRWIAAVTCGCSYLVLAATAGALTTLVAIAPEGLIEAVAGLALIGAFGGALTSALKAAGQQTQAIVTMLVAASGIVVFGVGAAFWALVAGLVVHALLERRGTRVTGSGVSVLARTASTAGQRDRGNGDRPERDGTDAHR
ncbi:benzoate/H(+) symporter BenE family transporter [Pseudoclavibacter sp. CFCC 13611]|uniref:benzoate/H(+) symporter BenE family transporter n=1 Tax=Pseudoclavibacter sp. CFCC 13611 TaxID=2615178 RepID=UPI0013017305|nr:benzoate/H(+) symporter BenE family transporter [Pseudoclavibacter sp. CFCC 13611]KAB1662990.1 benzoate/H(+) symporter BenE family transporter [Pseudoclavibacter sp. CFCC 13611]